MKKVWVRNRKTGDVAVLIQEMGRIKVKWPRTRRLELFDKLRTARRKLGRKGFIDVYLTNPNNGE